MPSIVSVVVFFDGSGQVNPREVSDVESGLLLQPSTLAFLRMVRLIGGQLRCRSRERWYSRASGMA
ncbi:hypothetical protein TIFTF001_023969 [Ficus carica]|uniref:Uncharacterized protein n=1 Tax=Ficus carica TaxID=3494 RepID=A0AA88AVB6_FICCA|nr:hypothetical protein TIFTF001_023969 [Ficus carica]